MKMHNSTPARTIQALSAAAFAALLLAACSSTPTRPMGADAARANLTQLQADPQLVRLAPVALKDAETAVIAAEAPQKDVDVGNHLVVIADRKVEIARAQAQSRLLEDQRKTLAEQREAARLEARTREADKARADANVARGDANMARRDANAARSDANISRVQADSARADTEAALLQADDLQRQLTELNARTTERGLVVTLGDVLFASGRAELKGGTPSNLAKLAAFLNKYQDRTVFIEGHTDSSGSDEANRSLSERRAGAVRSYLISQGVAANRITSSGLGEGTPVASNASSTGRAQNRRVEVIIASTAAVK